MSAPLEDTKGRPDWRTPAWLFDRLHAEFSFTVDAAAEPCNAKLPRFWDPTTDGLAQDWSAERVWCNPPYGKAIAPWVAKAATCGALAVVLVPARTESRWWADHAARASELRFLEGRVHFDPPVGVDLDPRLGSRPQWASVVLVFGNGPGPRVSTFRTPLVEARRRQLKLLPTEAA